MNVVYVVEIVVFLIVAITVILISLKKDAGKCLKYCLVSLVVFVLCLIGTFLLEKPTIDLSNFQTLEAKTEAMKPKTFYHFKNVTKDVKINGDIDTNKIGEYDVEIEVPVMFGNYSKKTKVKVVDSTKPELVLVGESEYKTSYKTEFEEPGFSAIDSFDGDITDKVEISKKEINESECDLIYKVSDSSGNVTEKSRHLTYTDDIPPEFDFNGNKNINLYLHVNDDYDVSDVKAIDEKDGDVSDTITVEGDVNTAEAGVYTVKYTAKDKSGNEAVVNRCVVVSEPGKVYEQDGTNGKKGVIYLTFDDGPSLSTTPKILDVLDRKGVKATFFIINYDDEREALVKREHESGHTVAIHGYSHTYSQIYASDEAYINNITSLQDKIKESIGVEATVTRFPGGSSNTISRHYSQGIMTRLCYEMVERGFTYFDWNVDSDDAGSAKTSDDVYRNVTKRLSKDKANVVLMHDFSGNTKTLNALESVIDYGLANGYTFEAIQSDTPMVTHKTNN